MHDSSPVVVVAVTYLARGHDFLGLFVRVEVCDVSGRVGDRTHADLGVRQVVLINVGGIFLWGSEIWGVRPLCFKLGDSTESLT